jgi:phosphotriesterase-related protein
VADTVQTATGPVAADDIGTTLIHEHVRFRDEAVAEQWPDRYDGSEEYSLAVEAVQAALERGVKTICEPTAMFGGRDIDFIRRVAEETGAQIVACTGIYTYDYLPPYFQNREAEAIAEHFTRDIEEGIQGTEIKAGFLKCACDEPGMTANVEKVHRAVAKASIATGAPIMAHSRPASDTGPLQVDVFLDEGVDPAKVQIAHTGDSEDLDYIEGLLERGVYIGMDRYGLELFLPIEKRNATLAELLRRGHAEQMMLSQDFCATIDWFPQEAEEQLIAGGLVREDWSMTLIFDQVIPVLREEGMTNEQLDAMLVEAPRRWLAGA